MTDKFTGERVTDNWLAEELRAAVEEVASWPPGMRRGIDVEPMRKSMDRITDAQGGMMTRPETYDELVEFRARLIEPTAWDRKDAEMSECFWAYACWKSMVRARATLEAERAVGIVPVAPVSGAFSPQVEAAKSVACGVDKTTLIVAINAAIAATPYQEDGK